jgi:cytochrome c-type biogenesis protein CcmF
VGFGVMALGTGIALLPEQALSFAMARLPAEAATTTMLLLALLFTPAVLKAQHQETGETVPLASRSPLERDIGRSLVCMCGTCGRQLAGECACATAGRMREEIKALVGKGMTKAQVLDFYIAKYGSQEPLAAPIDQGFNRLAWLFPYLLGVAGLLAVVLVTRRWSHHPQTPAHAAAGDAGLDRDLNERLDDELRNLD